MVESEIAKKAIKGDDQAFLKLMQLYKDTLYRTAFAFLKMNMMHLKRCRK